MLNTRHRAPLALALLLAFTGLAQANEPSVQSDSRQLTAGRDAAAYSVRISYPDGRVAETQLLAGESMPIDAASPGGLLADGQYNYEFVPITGVMRRGVNDVPRAGERLRASMPSRSGTFRVVGGRVIAPEQQPISITDQDYGVSLKHQLPEVSSGSTRNAPAKDQVIPDDLIVQGSICAGFDCVNNENFGADTLRLKENNLRIHFDDTSASAGFPSNDWRLTINDQASGGASYFSIDDATSGRRVFEARAGAPSNALVIDSAGRIGLRTSTPVLDMHISTSNTPGMRLEQTSAGGFTAQSWDVAANEANFFIRDVTGGSRLPFRIQPGAPSNSVYISAAGNVGMGTASPAAKLDAVVNDPGFPTGLRIVNQSTSSSFVGMRLETAGPTPASIDFNNAGGEWRVNFNDGDAAELTLTAAGNLTIPGTLRANGSNFPDYVFRPGYKLLSLREVEEHILQFGHLPNMPSALDVERDGIDVVQMQKKAFEKIEELTLYLIEQQQVINDLKRRLNAIEGANQTSK